MKWEKTLWYTNKCLSTELLPQCLHLTKPLPNVIAKHKQTNDAHLESVAKLHVVYLLWNEKPQLLWYIALLVLWKSWLSQAGYLLNDLLGVEEALTVTLINLNTDSKSSQHQLLNLLSGRWSTCQHLKGPCISCCVARKCDWQSFHTWLP